MKLRYGFVDGHLAELNSYRFTIDEAEQFASLGSFYIPIYKTRLVAVSNVQREIEMFFRESLAELPDFLSAKGLIRSVELLIAKNSYYDSGYISIRVHRNFKNPIGLSASLFYETADNFSSRKPGVDCIVKRTLYHVPVIRTSSTAICFSNEHGYIDKTNTNDGILVFKGSDCFYPQQYLQTGSSAMFSFVAPFVQKMGCSLTPKLLREPDLYEADEILFPNSQRILDWCKAMGQKRYFSRKFKALAGLLMQS